MNKTLKLIIYCAIALATGYFTYFIYGILRYSHSTDWNIWSQYTWIFKDSIRSDLDTNSCYSYVKKRDIYNNFHYKHIYNIIVWEFKDLDKLELNKIAINQNVNLDNLKFSSGEVLNDKSDIEITLEYGFAFNNSMSVNLDRFSTVDRTFEKANYIGFYGTINQISLGNNKNDKQILFHYVQGKKPTLFLLYKGHKSFYIIVINSEKPFDENIIKILNLS
jgi:hypothetical protein